MTVDMRSFLQQIKKTNDLFIVKKGVSTKYEIAAVTEKLDESKAALFENVKGSKFKLISNLVGSRDRFAQAIGSKKSDINQKIVKAISSAKKNSIFMHCLPAHRGEEIDENILEHPKSVVWQEAENRLHTQKAILNWCLKK